MVSFSVGRTVEQIAREYAELIKKEMNISGVYLYGSYTKGTYLDDSDIDIAVVGDDFVGDPVEDTFRLMKIRREIDNRIEPHPFKSSDFNSSNPSAREILATGMKIL